MRIEPQNPFDPTGWTGRVEPIGPYRRTLVAGSSIEILDNDPMRLWFEVVPTLDSSDLRIWPEKQNSEYGIGCPAGQHTILIHNASRPGAVQGRWFAWTDLVIGDVIVYGGRVIT
jgi:hypothetical protein